MDLNGFTNESTANMRVARQQQELLKKGKAPISNEEGREFITVICIDYFGLAWTVLHLIETAPGWPLWDFLKFLGMSE